MVSIAKLVLGYILRFLWDKAEDWYQTELRYQLNKRKLIKEVKDVARKAADRNQAIAVDRESVDDSLLRLEAFAKRSAESDKSGPTRIGRPVFGDSYRRGDSGDSESDPVDVPELSSTDSGGDSGAEESERPAGEPVATEPGDSMPTT